MVMLESTAALGIVMLHYEHVRRAWLQTQDKLHNSRRVEALGRIAGGVAHDFNNILTVVHAEIDLIKISDSDEERDESLEVIMEAVARATRLTTQLLTFGRQSSVKPTDVDVREVVESTLDLLRRVTPKQIEIVFESEQRAYPMTTDRSLLEQVVLNLVSNAKDALPEGGRIEVRLSLASDPIPSLQLSVRDNGEGMSEDVLDRVYEPFFTTKEVGDGTGLGLAAVHGAVAQLNAQIRVKSKEHYGTTFEVLLPF
ncbi:MAG: hypothetical protein JKY37_33780 [Nannocystaceae bacterium]|nr:hypothetical protein [Nannocystaceae bacterium]